MPHEIDQTTGSAAVFTVGTPPWHGLGQLKAEERDDPTASNG